MKTLSITLASLLLVSAACDGGDGGENGEPKKGAEAKAGQDAKRTPTVIATRVESARIQTSAVEIRLVRPGEVESIRDVNLAAPMGGLVEKLSLEVGDQVDSGDVIAKVDSKLMAAQLQLTRVEVKDAKRELERLESMGKAVARVRVDQAKTRVERAEAQARVAAIQSDRTFVRAPFDATVAAVIMEKGEVAPPGGVLVRLVQLDPALISVSVADRDVGNLEVGGKAMVTAGGAAQPVEGKIVRIDPTADLKTRSFKVEVEVANPEATLKPGMIATVDFRQEASGEQLIIPQHFLVTKMDSNGVFLVDDEDTARWRELSLGAVVRDQVVVESGLEAGDVVVTVGHRGLVDGDKLIVGRQGVCCTDGRIIYDEAGGRPDLAAAAPSGKPASPDGAKSDAKAEGAAQ
jgi:RND family efflux transporter MFP subunit